MQQKSKWGKCARTKDVSSLVSWGKCLTGAVRLQLALGESPKTRCPEGQGGPGGAQLEGQSKIYEGLG